MATLNIRCGSDIRERLADAGVEGDFLEFSDPVCQGPTPAGLSPSAFRDARAEFISTEYGLPPAEAQHRLQAESDGLDAAGDYNRIVLWFEHDLYDQSVLARLLGHFCARPALWERISLICIDRYPGVERFIGLGQLSQEQLAELPKSAVPVSPRMFEAARAAWEAFTAPEPSGLNDLVREGVPDLPFMAPALHRHLQEYPSVSSGLSLTQHLALKAFESGCATAAEAFTYVHRAEAAPWLGDLMFWPVVAGLGAGPRPALTSYGGPHSRVQLTDVGRALIDGQEDWVRLNGSERWVGGVRLAGAEAAWRYDQTTGCAVPFAKA